MDKTIDNDRPWDIKKLTLYFSGEEDSEVIVFQVFDDDRFAIYAGGDENPKWNCEDMDIASARRLRDFLNYAVPNV